MTDDERTRITKDFQNGVFTRYPEKFELRCLACGKPANMKVESWGGGYSWGQIIYLNCPHCGKNEEL